MATPREIVATILKHKIRLERDEPSSEDGRKARDQSVKELETIIKDQIVVAMQRGEWP